jgi:DNA invertase Pin-like site-specific DNA recombinase
MMSVRRFPIRATSFPRLPEAADRGVRAPRPTYQANRVGGGSHGSKLAHIAARVSSSSVTIAVERKMMSPAHTGRYASYVRVSTDRQHESGLGEAAQREAVRRFMNGGELLREFVETESGKRTDNRPVLAEALAFCKKHKATLLVAKLDRLSRNVAFIAALLDSNVKFRCCDFPEANKMMLQLLSIFAEWEREQISRRTREALARRKVEFAKVGKKLGGRRRSRLAASKRGAARNRELADAFARNALPMINEMRNGGLSMSATAKALTLRGVATRKGGVWSAMQVSNVLKRSV